MIELQGITKSFGTLQVLKGIDLMIEKGEVVSIVGPSGAGKTTLLQIMGTLDKADTGTILLNGTEVSCLKEKELSAFRNRQIGFVFPFKKPRKAMVGMSVLCTVFYVLLVMAHTQGAAIALLFAFAISMSGLNPTAVASAGRMTSVTSMGIMLPVASSGAILMPWIIGMVAERAGLAAGMASNIVPCVGLVVFAILVAKLPEE